MLDPITYACGCINQIDPEWGVLRSVSKCAGHIKESGKSGLAHYREMGCISREGVPQNRHYAAELSEALLEMDAPLEEKWGGEALEVGCGVGNYVPMLMQKGYRYLGVEPDAEAAEFTRSTMCVQVDSDVFERRHFWNTTGAIYPSFDLILAAHVFEHLPHAPEGMRLAYELLNFVDGRLILIVPNDDDPVNPDHLWMFSESTLRSSLERVGFHDVRIVTKRRVKHELFLYASAIK